MINQKVISIIQNSQTHIQLDTCMQWVKHFYTEADQTTAKAFIQQKRNEIDRVQSKFAPEHIAYVQSLES